jgi:hypothetical protein
MMQSLIWRVSCARAHAQYPFVQGVDIERIDLGDVPPAIGGAKTFTSSADEAILEAPLMWGSNLAVRVSVRIKVLSYVLYIPVEVSNVQAGGSSLRAPLHAPAAN